MHWAWMLMVGVGAAHAAMPSNSDQRVREATFTFVPDFCAGAVVGDAWHGITAAHCVTQDHLFTLRFSDGSMRQAQLVFVDRERDLAILEWKQPARVQPLVVSQQVPEVGEPVVFAGRPDRAEAQTAKVARLGRCPSLPGVSEALFTTVRGARGDSGSPLVDEQLRVVGLIHGGAVCNIATPTASAASVLDRLVGRRLQCAPEQPRLFD